MPKPQRGPNDRPKEQSKPVEVEALLIPTPSEQPKRDEPKEPETDGDN